MKRFFISVIAFFSGVIFTLLISWSSGNNRVKDDNARPVMAVRKVKPAAGVSNEEFEKMAVKMAHGDYGVMPGVKEYIAKGERGNDEGGYLYVVEFDSKVSRNFYYPKANDSVLSGTSEEAKKFMEATGSEEENKMIELVPEGKYSYTDYEIIK